MDSLVSTLLHGKKQNSLKHEETGKTRNINIDDVLIGKEIGRGEFGAVYEAKWLTEKKKVAVKIVDGTRSQCDIQVFIGLRHHNLVRTFGIINIEKSWIIMELATHGNLLQYLTKRSPLSATRLHSWINDLLCGVTFLHDNNIIHRNLKSLNCLIFESVLKVSDALTNQRSFKEDDYLDDNVPWMAPEVLGDPTKTTSMSDVYSVGIIVNEIMTGKKPYEDYTYTKRQLMRKIIHAELRPTVQENCGSELLTILKKTWEKDPSERPSANEFLRLFQRSYMTSPTHAKDVRISSIAKRLFLDTKDCKYNIKCLHILPSGYPVISCMLQSKDHVSTKLIVFKSDFESKIIHESASDQDEPPIHICTSIAANNAIYALCLDVRKNRYILIKFGPRGNNLGRIVLEGLISKLDTLHLHGLACDSLEFIYVITCQSDQPQHSLVKFKSNGKQCGALSFETIPFLTWIDIKTDILWVARHKGTCRHHGDNVIGAFDLHGNPLTSIINPSLVCKCETFIKNFCLAISPNGFLIVSDYSGTRYVLNYQGNVLYVDCRERSNVLFGNMAINGNKYLIQLTWNAQGFPDIIQYYNILADYKFS